MEVPSVIRSKTFLIGAGLVVLLGLSFGFFLLSDNRPAPVNAAKGAKPSPPPTVQRQAKDDPRNRKPVEDYRRNAGNVPDTPQYQPVVTQPPRPAVVASAPAPRPPKADLPLAIGIFDEPFTPPSATPPPASATAGGNAGGGPSSRKPARQVSGRFLPYGEPIKCALVFAVASDSSETPVVGVVTEDRYFDGRLILPKGTKVHGSVNGLTGPTRARKLRTGQRWTIVFPQFEDVLNGTELTIRATALNRAETGPGAWAVADGDGGLRGETIYDPTPDRVRQFATAFLASASSGLQSTVSVATREGGLAREVENTPRNAALGGVSAVLAAEVARIQDEIRTNGAYVFVPSGATFYLYPLQTVDLTDARRGDSSAFVRGPESDFDAPPASAARREEFPIQGANPNARQPVPSAYGRGTYDLTRPEPDPATQSLRPTP